jgi:hypothetical protein
MGDPVNLASLEQIAPPAFAEVDAPRVAAVRLAKRGAQPVGGLGDQDQVDVIVHQALCVVSPEFVSPEFSGVPGIFLPEFSWCPRNFPVSPEFSCSPHVFRHTAGVWMAQADVPMQKISQFLGHTSTRVTERTYARHSPSFMRDAAAALNF